MSLISQIDPTQPTERFATTESVRLNFEACKDEIEGLANGSVVHSNFQTNTDSAFGGNISIGKDSFEPWHSTYSTIQLGGIGFLQSTNAQAESGTIQFGNNAYFDGAWKYVVEDEASFYHQINGIHEFYVAPSGAADSNISWIKTLTLDDTRLSALGVDVSLGDDKSTYYGTDDDLFVRHSGTFALIRNETGTLFIDQYVNSDEIQLRSYDSVGVSHVNAAFGGATPYVRLYYDGGEVFHTISNGVESGTFSATGDTIGIEMISDVGAIHISKDDTTSKTHISFFNPNGQVGSIVTSGTTTAYNTTSDKRYKNSHGLVTDALSILENIDVHHFTFKSDPTTPLMGIMAQDANLYYPQAITAPTNKKDSWQADYSQFVPLLLAAVQQLSRKIH